MSMGFVFLQIASNGTHVSIMSYSCLLHSLSLLLIDILLCCICVPLCPRFPYIILTFYSLLVT